jgi:hypothetical protein
MGTRARWFRSRYRYRLDPDGGWTHADTLTDIRTDLERHSPRPPRVQVQRRARGDSYADHGALVLGRRGQYRRELPGPNVRLVKEYTNLSGRVFRRYKLAVTTRPGRTSTRSVDVEVRGPYQRGPGGRREVPVRHRTNTEAKAEAGRQLANAAGHGAVVPQIDQGGR